MARLKLEIVFPDMTVEEVQQLVLRAGLVSPSGLSEIDAFDVAATAWGENEGFEDIDIVVNELVEGDE